MIVSNYGLEKTNVLFITLDCCRYDTFVKAHLPFIKKIGRVRKAKTHGSYTLPAHMSFFMGYLPVVQYKKDPYYTPEVRQLWRLSLSRPRDLSTVGILLDGRNILEGYRKLGFLTIGTGGVRWFANKTLTSLFDKFFYFGDDTKNVFLERSFNSFSLNHLPELIAETKKSKNFFFFINAAETHVPYDFGEGAYSQRVKNTIDKAKGIWGCKKRYSECNITKEDLQELHKAQITSLESVDKKIQNLIDQLPKPIQMVITGDHGECFGENMNWGHGYPHPKVMEVPLVIARID